MKYQIQIAFKNESGSLKLLQKEFEAVSAEEALKLAKADCPFVGVIFSDPKLVAEQQEPWLNIGTQAETIINLKSASNIRIGD